MDEKELETEINKITGIDPGIIFVDEADWSSFKINHEQNVLSIPAVDELKEAFDKLTFTTSKNPPEDILRDVSVADIATHYIIDRISRDEVVDRVHKIWPEANGLDFSAFMDKLDKDKAAYWSKVRGEQPIGD
jgi:hypothetical protein